MMDCWICQEEILASAGVVALGLGIVAHQSCMDNYESPDPDLNAPSGQERQQRAWKEKRTWKL